MKTPRSSTAPARSASPSSSSPRSNPPAATIPSASSVVGRIGSGLTPPKYGLRSVCSSVTRILPPASRRLSRLLAGGRIRVTELHTERNPYFGGVNPEPIRPNIDEALGIVAAGGFDLGLLLDGDADRAGAVDERGVFIHQLQVYGLLMYYLVEHRGMHAPVVKSVNTTSMADRLGQRYGIAVHETPVGFKYVGPRMIETGAMYGGEESGGYGFGMHLPERDGIYADLLLLDLFRRERAAGR